MIQLRGELRCHGCTARLNLGRHYQGCPNCGLPLAVEYSSPPQEGAMSLSAALAEAGTRVPVAPTYLGQGETPLLAAPINDGPLWLKWEPANPTLSHKDRMHGVVSAMAVALGHRGIITSSTGNNGVAAAAFARKTGLSCVVIPHSEMPETCLRAIHALGATLVRPEGWTSERQLLDAMVADGWMPVTSIDPAETGWANPYIAEGYRAVGVEICRDLGAIPDAVFVPVAGGDTFYGVWCGLRDVAQLAGKRPPRMMAVQASGAAWTAEVRRTGRPDLPEIAHPHTAALSIRSGRNGRHVLRAIDESNGEVVTVDDNQIPGTLRRLASWGLLVETTSCLVVAAVEQARRQGLVNEGSVCVAVITSSIFKWPDTWGYHNGLGAIVCADQWDRWRAAQQERLSGVPNVE